MRLRRGVSPVLATIMMVVVGTSAATVAYTFSSGVTQSQIATASEQLTIENVKFVFPRASYPHGYIGVVLRNVGSVDIDVQKCYIDKTELTDRTSGGTTEEEARVAPPLWDEAYTLEKQKTGWFIIEMTKDIPVEKSRSYHLKLVTVKGIAVEGYFVSPPVRYTLLTYGFETGDFSGWIVGGVGEHYVSTESPHTGDYSAVLGFRHANFNNVPIGSDWMYLTFTIPAKAVNAELAFSYRVITWDDVYYDSFDVYVRDPLGNVLAHVVHDGGSPQPTYPQDLGWKQKTFDLTPYAGKTVQLYFSVENRYDNTYPTWCFIDDVRLSSEIGS